MVVDKLVKATSLQYQILFYHYFTDLANSYN